MDSGTLVRRSNRSAVLEQLLTGRESGRPELVTSTGLSQATVFRVVNELVESRILVEGPSIARAGRGRNAGSVRFNESIALVCGIDLGGTNCRLVLSDALGRTLARRRYGTLHDVDGEAFGSWLAGCVSELVEDAGGGVPLGGVTVGLAAAISGDKTRVVGAQNLPQIRSGEFLTALRGRLDAPVHIDNDSNLALLGELRYGAVDSVQTTVLLVLGTGLSGAVAMDGRILSGVQGLLGEFGRLPMPGRQHRLRDLLSGAGMAAYAEEFAFEAPTTAAIFAHPNRYAPLVAQAYEAFDHLVDIVALAYEPASILVAGGYSESFSTDDFERTRRRLLERLGVSSQIERSQLAGDAGLLGAMAHALGHLHVGLGASGSHQMQVGPGREEILERFRSHNPDLVSPGVSP